MNKALSVMKSSSDDVAANMLHMIAKNSAPDLRMCVHIYINQKPYIHRIPNNQKFSMEIILSYVKFAYLTG